MINMKKKVKYKYFIILFYKICANLEKRYNKLFLKN